MRSRYWLVMSVALVAVTVAPTMAQTARSLAMGNAAVAVADDSAAWSQNPAGLPHLQISPMSLNPWPSRVSGTINLSSDTDTVGINYSARSAEDGRGWGAGYWQFEGGPTETQMFGGGYGMTFGRPGLSWGAAVRHTEVTVPGVAGSSDETVADVGAMYHRSLPASEVKFGLVARDVTDQMTNTFDLGASLRLPTGLLAAADIQDFTDEVNSAVNVGAEWQLPTMPNLTVRAGLADGDPTYGVGYDLGMLAVSVSVQQLDWDDVVSATLSAAF